MAESTLSSTLPALPAAPRLGLSTPDEVLVSSPIDLTIPLSSITTSIAGKTILVTGGASGIGRGCVTKLVKLGANVAIADINEKSGEQTVKEIEMEAGIQGWKGSVKFFQCNVVKYESQAKMFLEMLKWSPGGAGVFHCAIVNAGVAERGVLVEDKDVAQDPHAPPAPPNLTTFNVNFLGALFTVRLAHHFLQHSPIPDQDKHILLIGSFASFLNSPMAPLYSSAKHGLLGLFCSLRLTSIPAYNIRINFLAPYFVQTPIMPNIVRLMLAGQEITPVNTLVDSMVRLIADEGIKGRILAVGPGIEEDVDLGGGLDAVETFSRRAVRMLNTAYWGRHWWKRWGRIIRDAILVVVAWGVAIVALKFW